MLGVMVHEMITLPLRVGICATRRGVRVTTRAAGVAFRITRLVIGQSMPAESHAAAAHSREPSNTFELEVVMAASPPPSEAAPARVRAASGVVAAEPEVRAAPEIPPAHVSEGLQFVEAFAEPGAEEGAGAAVHIREPLRGYAELTADEVIEWLADASSEQLAAVALYEGAHRRRKTVLAEASRRLRSTTTGRPTAQAGRA
jgi:hypothetical protein